MIYLGNHAHTWFLRYISYNIRCIEFIYCTRYILETTFLIFKSNLYWLPVPDSRCPIYQIWYPQSQEGLQIRGLYWLERGLQIRVIRILDRENLETRLYAGEALIYMQYELWCQLQEHHIHQEYSSKNILELGYWLGLIISVETQYDA